MNFLEKLIPRIQALFRTLYFAQPKELTRMLGRFTRNESVLILIAAGIGIATGGVILAFNWAVEFAGDHFLELFALSQFDEYWQYLLIPLIPALGGLGVGLLQVYVFKTRAGHGVPEVILASRFSRGDIQRRVMLQKLLTGALSIGSGGGGGREGPIIHVGAAVGISIANLFRLTRDQSRTLIACGAAAGISGIFNAPMGGVMFVLEVILGDFRLKTFTPVVVSAVAATAITRNAYGSFVLVQSPTGFSIQLPEYLLFVVLGIIMGLMSAYFTRVIIMVENWSHKQLRMSEVFRPAIGGLMAGVLILFLPAMMEQTYEPINQSLHATLPIWLMLVVAFLKPWHTAITTGSGGTGGVFAPALKSGAMIGSVFGMIMMMLFPSVVQSPTAYALSGMGAILAGTMHAPLTGILILIEISNDYSIVLPAMLTAILATMIAQRFQSNSIYTWSISKPETRIGSFAYVPLLSAIPIEQIVEHGAAHVTTSTPIQEILLIFENTRHDAVLVLDDDQRYLGLIEFEDVRSFITERELVQGLVAADVMVTSIKPVYENTTLDVILKLFDDYGWSVLPVLSPGEDKRAIGLVTASDAQTYYRRSVTRETV
ncbi:MAG: chloride channel protein [Bacteroidetes bacterium]|nr:chloride channel protein [Bacteroidota bacterium]